MISPRNALFIQLRRIGDVLMCTPAIRAFKKQFPNCSLDFLTEYPEVLEGNPYIDSLIPVDPSRQLSPPYQFHLIRSLRKNRYDMVIDFFANPRSAYYSFLTGAETRLSYGFGHRRWAYNLTPSKPENPVYAAGDRLHLLSALEVHSDDFRLEFYPGDRDREEARKLLSPLSHKPILTVSPVSRRNFNRWPLENYARLIEMIVEEFDFVPLVLTGPGEGDVADRLAALISGGESMSLNINSLGLLGAIFELAKFHIGNDNGPKHIAVACGSPTFTIYGPHSHISWTYPDFGRHGFITPGQVDPECRVADHKCGPDCIKKITADAAFDRFRELVSHLPVKISTPESQ